MRVPIFDRERIPDAAKSVERLIAGAVPIIRAPRPLTEDEREVIRRMDEAANRTRETTKAPDP